MSEITAAPLHTSKSRLKILLLILSLLLLLLVYGAGMLALPALILTTYQSKNCDSALTLDKIYTSLYPRFVELGTLSAPIKECEAYGLAVSSEEKESWREAYDAYQAYSSTYPNGLYLQEAHQHSAAVLLNLAQDQIEQEQYAEALANLNLIVASYSDTGVITDAWNLFPSVYTPWGVSLREAGDFARSEQILNEFETWSLTNQKSDWATEAQRELAQTYLAWGLNLQSQKQFETAIAKFKLTISADPESQFDSTAKGKAGQSSAYIGWGNDLLEQDQFPVAMEKFELAVSNADETNADVANDAVANGQIQWAHTLSTDEDFEGALEHLGLAKEAATSGPMKKAVDVALQDTYLSFSTSSGSQARRAMKEVLKTICEKHKAPDLPIFGLNKDSIRFGIHGVEDQLPENLLARTPGEMHYVACVTADNKTIESRQHKNIILQFSRGYLYVLVDQFRVQLIWNVRLLNLATGKSVAEQSFTGGTPPPFSETGGNYFYGPTPLDELTDWLPSVTQ